MRAARLVGPRELQVVERAEPQPGPGEVLVRVRACGICASDLNAWRGVSGIEYPLPDGAPGHETWGEVVAVGQDVDADALPPGQRVTGLLQSGLSELGLARAQDLVRIERPLLGEPLACAVNIIRRAGPFDLVVFVGFGYLATLCAQVLPAGAGWIALSRREETRDFARRLGAQAAYSFQDVPPELWDNVPVVIEAAGVQETLNVATWLTAYSGRLVIAGYHADGPRTINMQSWNWKGIDVINAHDRRPEVFVRALREGIRLVADRRLDLAALQTHEFSLEDAAAAFRIAEDRPSGFVKAVVRL